MWEVLGPIVEDYHDELLGAATYIPKEAARKVKGELVPSGDLIRRFRSSAEDLNRLDMPLESYATRELRKAKKKDSLWNRITRWGFDDVIGPALEAMVRKPMALHHFHERYQMAKSLNWWRVDEGAIKAVEDTLSRVYVQAKEIDPEDLDSMLKSMRQVIASEGDASALKWTNTQTAAWINGHEPEEIVRFAQSAQRRAARAERTAKRGGEAWQRSQLTGVASKQLLARDPEVFRTVFAPNTRAEDFLAYIRKTIDPDSMRSVELLRNVNKEAIEADPILARMSDEDWKNVVTLHKNLAAIEKEAGDYAAIAGIEDMMPFIDSHEIRSQWAQVVKPLMPFWYAEENFLKRWARTVMLDPTVIRKGQLAVMGLKNVGAVREDESGKQWFVYPGGTLFADVLRWLPFTPNDMPTEFMFQTPLNQLLPGLNGSFGTPSFSPFVTVPLDALSSGFAELQPLERAVSGDLAANRAAWRHLVPSFLVNTAEAMFSHETPRMASSMMTSMALQDAYGMGLQDDATPGQIDEYLDRTRNQARIISLGQALLQFFTPGPPSAVQDKEQPFFAIGGIDPKQMFTATYQAMIQEFGIEEGTLRYLQLYPNHGLNDIINPRALTVAQSESTSGAPIPPTEEALSFYNANKSTMEEFPDAAPWLLPQDGGGQRVSYVQDQQYAVGLRRQRTPEEFLRALKYKQAAGRYFEQRDIYLNYVGQAREAKDEDAVRAANSAWSQWADIYKRNNPIFREELEFGDGRLTRERVIDQMRVIVADPAAPQAAHIEQLRVMMANFDNYQSILQQYASDNSNDATLIKEQAKTAFKAWAEDYVEANPMIEGFWLSVIRPESRFE
jgi:hypothetical protein